MTLFHLFKVATLTTASFLAVSCTPFLGNSQNQAVAPNPNVEAIQAAAEPVFQNPFPEGTYEHFMAEPDYSKTYVIYRNHELLDAMTKDSVALRIDLSDQRAQLLHEGQVAMDYPVATGKSSHPTPTGEFSILEKIKDKRSNTYGRILNSSGGVVNSDADSRSDTIPPGGKFVGASMPYWMRFTWTGIGHHVGNVPRYAASHGCIRGRSATMPEIYSRVKVGTPVSIVE